MAEQSNPTPGDGELMSTGRSVTPYPSGLSSAARAKFDELTRRMSTQYEIRLKHELTRRWLARGQEAPEEHSVDDIIAADLALRPRDHEVFEIEATPPTQAPRPKSEVGLREIRQNTSDLVRRAEAGERIVITVSGRPAAVLGPVGNRSWRSWADIADVFSIPVDAEWRSDQELLDQSVTDPWDR